MPALPQTDARISQRLSRHLGPGPEVPSHRIPRNMLLRCGAASAMGTIEEPKSKEPPQGRYEHSSSLQQKI